MGDTISSLVFRPPKPTPIHPSEYFYLDVDVHSPLCTNKRRNGGANCGQEHGSCGMTQCLDTGESDLASLDNTFISKNPNNASGATINCVNQFGTTLNPNQPTPSATVPNMRNGQIYKIPAFFIRRRNASQTLLFSHGNAEDLGMMYSRMKDLAMVLGVNILAYDYTGYGLSIPGPAHGSSSSGSGGEGAGGSTEGPSENMIYRNIEAAFHYLTQVRKIPPRQIILYGRSLGSGPSCYLAAKTALNGESVGGLILHSPFLSVYKVVADLNGLDLGLVGDLFHNEKRARNVRCPTLIIHGREDEVVPFWHAQRLLAAIPPEFRAQPYYVEDMGHNHIESRCREQYVKAVLNFLRMGVWQNNRTALGESQQGYAHGSNGAGYSPSTVPTAYSGPSPIPIHERASPSETKENASFYVNKTWLRHAKVLLKEVFADAGCYANSVSDDNDSNSSRWSVHGQLASRRASQNEVDGYNKGMSDARDDEDEFAPWRHGSEPRNRTTTSGSNSNSESSGRRRHQLSQSAPGKVLTTRVNDGSKNNRSRPSTPASGNGGRGGYHKAQSENVSQNHSKSPSRKLFNQQQKWGYGKSKSMALLEGMSRQKRY